MCRNAIKCSPARFYSMNFGVPKDIQQPNNFNMIRLFLAIYIFLSHFLVLSGGNNSILIIEGADRVRGFFVISGFLIYASFCRSKSLKSYFIKRGRRIFPSYFFVVIFFSIALFFISSLSLSEYFSSQWIRYLASNLMFSNFIEPTLPGVFTDNVHSAVNGSLWTIKIELMCYVALPVLVYLCRKTRANPFIFFGVIILLSIFYTFVCNIMYSNTGDDKYTIYARQIGGQLAYFVLGMMLYDLMELVILHKRKLFIIGILGIIVAYKIPETTFFIKPFAIAFIIIPVTFMGSWGYWIKSVDISYEFYLVHFPIIQMFIQYKVIDSIGMFPTLLLALAASIIMSLLCWHLVGKRFLRRSPRPLVMKSSGST